ncbi:hypothetical protein JJV70_06180 [Streptomyces sp. JJ66]|uniref:hypothetical protein n=1 Tax=Streptomyces sp. JJ66 TaxID=2803843 RepID=UPI001C57EEAD|nr:hypothetical protein [Streptomyces sp. JJ66]MBW1601706.1 hypothetical protein [Streptomyces sp. JJ66]
MRIHRMRPARAFSTYSNTLLRDHHISWCALGLLTYLLSLPESAKTNIRELAGLRFEGRDRVASALNELENARYLRRVQCNAPVTGRIYTYYELHDTPYEPAEQPHSTERPEPRPQPARQAEPAPAELAPATPALAEPQPAESAFAATALAEPAATDPTPAKPAKPPASDCPAAEPSAPPASGNPAFGAPAPGAAGSPPTGVKTLGQEPPTPSPHAAERSASDPPPSDDPPGGEPPGSEQRFAAASAPPRDDRGEHPRRDPRDRRGRPRGKRRERPERSAPPARDRAAAAPVSVPDSLRPAVTLLLSLSRAEPRLSLGTAEAVQLAPLVTQWRANGARDDTLRCALTSGLPTHVHSALGLLANRLRRKMPERPAPPRPARRLHECASCCAPLPEPGRCRPCRTGEPTEPPVSEAQRALAQRGAARARAALRTPNLRPA